MGSGKTVIAAFGAWLAWKAGWQAALMAPTEILAEQHAQTLTALLGPAGLRVGLLTGAAKRRKNGRFWPIWRMAPLTWWWEPTLF